MPCKLRPHSFTQQTAWRISPLMVALAVVTAEAGPPQASSKRTIATRTLRADESLPIPTPKPIVMNESWLVAGVPGVDPAPDSEVPPPEPAPNRPRPKSPRSSTNQPPDAPHGSPPDPTSPFPPGDPDQPPTFGPGMNRESGPGPGPGPGSDMPHPPMLGGPNGPGQSGPNAEVGPSLIYFPLGEQFTLRAFEQIGKTVRIVTNRKEYVAVLGADGPDGTLEKPAESVIVTGRKLGTVELTLIGETGFRRYLLRITPSAELIENTIARQFPLSSVEVTAAGDNMLVLDGSVESPGDVEGIVKLVSNFVGASGTVVNGIKISGVMQVQLEVIIARVDRAGLRRLGLNFEYAGKGGYAGSMVGNIGGVTPINSSVANNAATAGGNAFQSVGGTAASVVTPASTVFLGATHELQQFMAQIEALQQEGVAKVLAKPILTTLNGRPAEFLVGGEQPYPYQTSALTSPSVEFKKFGTRLNFVPVILGPDKIRLDLVPEHSSVNFTQSLVVGGNQVPQFITQRIHTTVEMEPGQTLVLGGLLQTESDAQVEKVPFLGDLPLVGAAFRRVRHQERELELIIIVTPRLVHPMPETDCPPPLPGDESRRPTDKELFWHGLPESPHELPAGGKSAAHSMPYDSASTGHRKASASGKAVVQQVADKKADRTSKSWVRLPSLYRKQQPPTQSGNSN